MFLYSHFFQNINFAISYFVNISLFYQSVIDYTDIFNILQDISIDNKITLKFFLNIKN